MLQAAVFMQGCPVLDRRCAAIHLSLMQKAARFCRGKLEYGKKLALRLCCLWAGSPERDMPQESWQKAHNDPPGGLHLPGELWYTAVI